MASWRTDHALRQDLVLRPNLRGALPLDLAIFLPLGAEVIIECAVSGNSKQKFGDSQSIAVWGRKGYKKSPCSQRYRSVPGHVCKKSGTCQLGFQAFGKKLRNSVVMWAAPVGHSARCQEHLGGFCSPARHILWGVFMPISILGCLSSMFPYNHTLLDDQGFTCPNRNQNTKQ